MPPGHSSSEIAPAALPAAAGYDVGDMWNAAGVLHVLRENDATDLTGTLGNQDANYVGVVRIDSVTSVGAWSDPAIRAEYTTVKAGIEGHPLHRIRLPKALWTSTPPETLYFRAVLVRGGRTQGVADIVATRNSDRDTTTVYAWASSADDVRLDDPQVGDRVTLYGFTAPFHTGLRMTTVRHWNPYQTSTQRADSAVQELARDATAKALIAGNNEGDVEYSAVDADDKIISTLRDGRVSASKIDADTNAKKVALQNKVGAEGKLVAGTGVTLGQPDAQGRRTVAVSNPVPRGSVGPQDAFDEPALDVAHDWRIPVVEHDSSHECTLVYDTTETPDIYQGSVQITPVYSAVVQYIRVGNAGGGKFNLTIEPLAPDLTLSTLFAGKTITHLALQIGSDAAAAEAATAVEYAVEVDTAIRNTLAMTFVAALSADPTPLASGTSAVVRVNFKFSDNTFAYLGAYTNRSLSPDALREIARQRNEVAQLPASPSPGDEVYLTAPQTIDGYGILVAALASTGDFTGYQHSGPAFGSLQGAPDNRIRGLASYADVAANNALRDKTVLTVEATTTPNPAAVIVNGTRYPVTASTPGLWLLTGADGTLLRQGHQYRVQVEWTGGADAYADKHLRIGWHTWNGVEWSVTPGSLNGPEDMVVGTGVALTAGKLFAISGTEGQFDLVDQAATWAQAGNADRIPAAKLRDRDLTQAQYDAGVASGTITADDGITYFISG